MLVLIEYIFICFIGLYVVDISFFIKQYYIIMALCLKIKIVLTFNL